MAFPFSGGTLQLRQRILLALGSGGLMLAAASCGDGKLEAPSCSRTPSYECLTRAQMEAEAQDSCIGNSNFATPGGPQLSAAALEQMFLPNGCLAQAHTCDSCCNHAATEGEPQGDGSCCYYYCDSVCCGRPLLIGVESRKASLQLRGDWLASALSAREPAPLPRGLSARIAAEWLEDARMEHASVAAFARFTLELLAFGAPSDLVADAQRAGADEVAHARACFSLAQHFGASAHGPAGLDLTGLHPATELLEAVRTTFIEGCVGETQAALLAQRALEHVHDPSVQCALAQIAEDEARHAELAWRFIAWALRRDGAVATVVEAALAAACAACRVDCDDSELDSTRAALHAAGRLTRAERGAVAKAALREVIEPCARALLAMRDSQAKAPQRDFDLG